MKIASVQSKSTYNQEIWALGNTPIDIGVLLYYLSFYPDRESSLLLSNIFRFGFKLLFSGSLYSVFSKYIVSAHEYQYLV
jgi:hypothetical protein